MIRVNCYHKINIKLFNKNTWWIESIEKEDNLKTIECCISRFNIATAEDRKEDPSENVLQKKIVHKTYKTAKKKWW